MNKMFESNETRNSTAGLIRPQLSYYHPNARGTGSAIHFELHPAHESTSGSIFVTMARQKTAGSTNGTQRIFPTFDWENRIIARLDISDLSQILAVLRGLQENIQAGKGLFHRNVRFSTIIRFEHRIEPYQGYYFAMSKKPDMGDAISAGILFSPAEALGLSLALEQVMGYIAFGIPMVWGRPAMTMPSKDDSAPFEDANSQAS